MLELGVFYDPLARDCGVVVEDHLAWLQVKIGADRGQRLAKGLVPCPDMSGPRNCTFLLRGAKPVSDPPYRGSRIVSVCGDVLARDIRDERLIAVLISV